MKDYKHIEHMRNLNDSLIWERMKRCYDYGYEDGKADTPFTDTEEAEKTAYEQGLNDSWECARKISMPENEGGMSVKALQSIFGTTREIFKCTASEAIAKIKEYEEKQNEIKVGDEIRLYDAIEVVTCVTSTGLQTIDANGLTSTWCYNTYPLETWEKTGRHFNQIAEVLKQMNEDGDADE